MDLQLSGRRALVTGGSRGIGFQVARSLLAEGARVAIAARDADRLAGAARTLGGEVVTATVDTGDDALVTAAVDRVREHLGGIDILVNCAAEPLGSWARVIPSQTTDQQFWDAVNVKTVGYLRTARAVAPGMVAQGWGRIINVSGLAARTSGDFVATTRNLAVAALASPRSVTMTGDPVVVGGGAPGPIHY
jgi:NAD(P)-dependent dehydrogenase (short-subunit alcohol dehydrogenase family)